MSGAFWLLLILLTVVLALVARALFKQRPPSPGGTTVDLGNLTVRDARRGDLVTIRNAGREYEDVNLKVEKVHRYEWGDESWYELVGSSPGGRVSLEWGDDDGLWISLTLPGSDFRLHELGLTEDELGRMDEEQSGANTIDHEGTTYHYVSSHEAGYFEDGRGEGEGFYLWNFESADGKKSIGIEKWEGEAFEGFVSSNLNSADVEIYRA